MSVTAIKEIHRIANEAVRKFDVGEYPSRAEIADIRELAGSTYPAMERAENMKRLSEACTYLSAHDLETVADLARQFATKEPSGGQTVSDTTSIIEIDELTLHIVQAVTGRERPEGMSARDAIRALEENNADLVPRFREAAVKAVEYMAECWNATDPGAVGIEFKVVTSESGGVQ